MRGKLRPVMTWKTRVMDVREVAAGETIGYNATFTAQGPMRVALLPVGYSDGLRRELWVDECEGGRMGDDCEASGRRLWGGCR